MRALAAILAVILALPLASACVKLERQPIEKRFYALETARPAAAVPASVSPAAAPGVLLVRRLVVSPRATGRELVYRTAPGVWSADYYNVYFVTPADMLTQDLRAWLGAAGVAAEVVDPSSLAGHDYILEGNVTSLHGDLASKPAEAVVEMQFLLLRAGGGERKVLMTRDYRKTAPLASNTPQELIRAQREAVAAVYAQLEADLRAVLPRK